MQHRALLLVALLVAVPACSKSVPPAATSGPTAPGTVRAAYAITGMHCGGCADAIVAEVGEVKGVKGVQCTFESKCAVIEFTDPAAKADAEHAITKLGYKIAPCEAPPQPAAAPESK